MSESDYSEDDIFEYQPLVKQKRKPVLHDENVKSLQQKAKRKPTVVNHPKSKSERRRKLKKSSLEKSRVDDLGAPSSSGGQYHGNGTQKSQTDVKEGNRHADCLDPNLRTQNANCSSVDTFCPICQMPLSIVIGSRDHHVFQCVQGYDRFSFEGECPLGLKCDVTISYHYQRYTHHCLSRYRAGLSSELTSDNNLNQESGFARIRVPVSSQNSQCTDKVKIVQTSLSKYNKQNGTNLDTSVSPSVLKEALQSEDVTLMTVDKDDTKKDTSRDKSLPVKRTARKSDSPCKLNPANKVIVLDPSEENDGCSQEPKRPAMKVQGFTEETVIQQSAGIPSPNISGANINSKECSSSLPRENCQISKTPSKQLPRNVARKSLKGKVYRSIEEVIIAQRNEGKAEKTSKHSNSRDSAEEQTLVQTSCSKKLFISDKHTEENKCAKKIDGTTAFQTKSEENDEDLILCDVEDEDQSLPSTSESGWCGDSTDDSMLPQNSPSISCEDEVSLLKVVTPKKKSMFQSVFYFPRSDSSSDSSSVASSNQQTQEAKQQSSWSEVFKGSKGTKFSAEEGSGKSQTVTNDGNSRHVGSSMWSKNSQRQCPFYKKMPGTSFAVDAFSYGDIPGITNYFLTHFHADHYGGLTKMFTNPIYCSNITANLVRTKLYVPPQYIHGLTIGQEHLIEGVKVIFLDANHCPGSVLILFKLPNGKKYLHTGDFRAHHRMESYPQLVNCKIDQLYLDTTYCDPRYDFPVQDDVINFAVNLAVKSVQLNKKTLIICGTYTIGKERVFTAISDALDCKICVESDKRRILACFDDPQLMEKIITDKRASRLHVVGMGKLNPKRLLLYLEDFHNLFDNILAFKPTGWTHSSRTNNLQDIKPTSLGRVQIYGIPYSEHSSYSELKRFVQFLHSNNSMLNIIPTVNVGRPAQRDFMKSHFKTWLSESKMAAGKSNGKSPQGKKTPVKQSQSSSAAGSNLMQFFKKKQK